RDLRARRRGGRPGRGHWGGRRRRLAPPREPPGRLPDGRAPAQGRHRRREGAHGPVRGGPRRAPPPVHADLDGGLRGVRPRPAGAAATHAYVRDVFPTDPFKRSSFTWKVHEQTHMIQVGTGVTVLVEATDLDEKLGVGGDDDKKDDRKGRGRGGPKREPSAP